MFTNITAKINNKCTRCTKVSVLHQHREYNGKMYSQLSTENYNMLISYLIVSKKGVKSGYLRLHQKSSLNSGSSFARANGTVV